MTDDSADTSVVIAVVPQISGSNKLLSVLATDCSTVACFQNIDYWWPNR